MNKGGGRVLSIQSHVVCGYVGNKSAVFPLQLLGLDVDPINSVQFSNHTGYPSFSGDVLQGDQLKKLVTGMDANGLLTGYTHLLTGYIGSESFLDAVMDVAKKLKSLNPGLTYVCDPVLGDEGKCYVPEALVVKYRKEVVPLADVLTPNQFEAELLTGIKITSEQDAQRACLALHALGPRVVIITSASFGCDNLYLLASAAQSTKEGRPLLGFDFCYLEIPKVPAYFTVSPSCRRPPSGTGDLIAALLLAWLYRLPKDLPRVLENAVATIQATIRRTFEAGCGELRLIQSKDDIENPKVELRAKPLFTGAISGVIFDMDGTLTLPGQIDFQGIRKALGIAPDGLTSERAREEALRIIETEELKGFGTIQLQPGAEDLIDWLGEHGYKVALATRNNEECVSRLQEAFGWHQVFTPALARVRKSTLDEHKILEVCEGWSLHPSSVLFVGDSLEDVQWSFNVGCRTCLIDIGASHSEATLKSGFVHYGIESLTELRELITATRQGSNSSA